MSTPSTTSAAPAASTSAANSLPDELLDKIFSNLVGTDTKQHPLYSVCLASRRFHQVAQPLLWHTVAFEVDGTGDGQAFVEAARQLGHYTRVVSLAFTKVAREEAYLAYTPVLKHMAAARRVQVVHDTDSEGRRFQPVALFDNIESTNLEHLGVLHLPRDSSMPRASCLRTTASLDLVGSGFSAFLECLYHVPGLMPSLRALAADLWWMPAIGMPDHLFAQLDMFQASVGVILNAGARPLALEALARHVSICRVFLDRSSANISTSLDNLARGIKAGNVKSVWLPRDPTSIGSPSDDVGLCAAWANLCDAARAAGIPGRFVGDAEDPRTMVGGQLDFGFWDYAKRLRAAGEV
ncbi:uncharacterized protein RHOBADRAFT_47000 [Rhodotorula graminis WP1]|uniref:F-box domain-containing protein n=1 Tax=Rhodotorula graminis (strain WP1) TaxID=578459 RepID=A0A0P9F952_RHOGW|nr:uncharacterized protein RHOBADRAFT_47000 [Rhodotorula graminis WP1]KPV72158.1 hypothetical protein RHOBADRAFT_47000 [Rhodotorula graminis WP1]